MSQGCQHTWPAELDADAACDRCGLAYDEYDDAPTYSAVELERAEELARRAGLPRSVSPEQTARLIRLLSGEPL
jgi:hypothetical protein